MSFYNFIFYTVYMRFCTLFHFVEINFDEIFSHCSIHFVLIYESLNYYQEKKKNNIEKSSICA